MIEKLLDAIQNYNEATSEYKKALKKGQYDSEYFLHNEIESVNKTKKELESALKIIVKDIVREEIKSIQSNSNE